MEYKNKISIVMKWYKIERWAYLHKFNLLATFIYHVMQILFGCTIPYSVDLRKGVNIAHFHGIVMHQNSVVDENTLIYSNVCLGGRNGKGGPVIGKNCVIGTGACILGQVNVGDNVNIGANAVVLNDIPSNCTVVGVPGKIVKWR